MEDNSSRHPSRHNINLSSNATTTTAGIDRPDLRAALQFAVTRICVDEDAASNNNSAALTEDGTTSNSTKMTPGAALALSELTYLFATTCLSPDLHAFAIHAGRKTLQTNDVLLATRKIPQIQQQLHDFCQTSSTTDTTVEPDRTDQLLNNNARYQKDTEPNLNKPVQRSKKPAKPKATAATKKSKAILNSAKLLQIERDVGSRNSDVSSVSSSSTSSLDDGNGKHRPPVRPTAAAQKKLDSLSSSDDDDDEDVQKDKKSPEQSLKSTLPSKRFRMEKEKDVNVGNGTDDSDDDDDEDAWLNVAPFASSSSRHPLRGSSGGGGHHRRQASSRPPQTSKVQELLATMSQDST